MNSWLLSLVGIAFLGVLIDILTPKNNMNKFIKSIFAIFLLFVIVSPIKNIISSKSKFFNTGNNVNVLDEDFLQKHNLNRIRALEDSINTYLIKNNIKGVNVILATNMLKFDFEIVEVGVDIKNLVLTENINHKNKYEIITNAIRQVINIRKEAIKFYE